MRLITNGGLQFVIENLSEKSECWRWIHSAARRFYVSVLTPILQYLLNRLATDESCKLCPRHSASTGKNFNIFRSDIDYAAIFIKEPSRETILRLENAFKQLRRIMPFIGELEYYTGVEWQRRNRLETESPELIEIIGNLRKAQWQLGIVNHPPSPFHRRKAEAALMRIAGIRGEGYNLGRILQGVSENLQSFINGVLANVAQPEVQQEVWGVSNFLGWEFGTSASRGGLILTAAQSYYLSAILPDGASSWEGAAESMRKIRENDKVKETYLILCEYELLLCQSVRRIQSGVNPNLEHWLMTLNAQLTPSRSPTNLTFSRSQP